MCSSVKYYPHIDVAEFDAIATSANITGNTFIKGTADYKKSLQFAKMFKSIKGYKKKDLTNIYVKINSAWDDCDRPVRWQYEDTDIKMSYDEHKQDIQPTIVSAEPTKNREDIYEIGTQFYYWNSHKRHKHYIQATYSCLKEEMLNNLVRCLDLSQWNILQTECKTDIATDIVRSIKSNGYWEKIYTIPQFTALHIRHITVLKL
eukprot:185203_1